MVGSLIASKNLSSTTFSKIKYANDGVQLFDCNKGKNVLRFPFQFIPQTKRL